MIPSSTATVKQTCFIGARKNWMKLLVNKSFFVIYYGKLVVISAVKVNTRNIDAGAFNFSIGSKFCLSKQD